MPGRVRLPLVPAPRVPAPGPQAASAVTLRAAGRGTARLQGRPQSHPPRTLAPEPHPLPGGADPSEGQGARQGPQNGLQLCPWSAGLLGARRPGGKLLSWPGRSASAVTGHRRQRRRVNPFLLARRQHLPRGGKRETCLLQCGEVLMESWCPWPTPTLQRVNPSPAFSTGEARGPQPRPLLRRDLSRGWRLCS